MASPGYVSTPRGQVNKYVYHRTDLNDTDPDKILNAEVSGLQGSDSLDGITQATLNAYQAANFWTVSGKVMDYNPITDEWGIQNGEYVL